MEQGIMVMAAMVVGWLIKKYVPNEFLHTKLIPWINYGVQFLGQLIAQWAVTPAEAGLFDGGFFKSIASIAVQAGLVTLLATGSHSTAKNTLEYFKQRALEAAQKKALDELSKPKYN